jgi:hypothetical protein
MSYFRESFISSGKQGGGATILWERHDIETRENCIPGSLNTNNLGKAAVLHLTFSLSSGAVAVPNSACRLLGTAVLMSDSHKILIICSPHQKVEFKMLIV